MKTLFDELVEEGERVLERLVDEAEPESVQLDFKRKTKPSNGEWEKADRQTFAKALSAFANSMGGLVIYGVEARPGENGVDAAVRLEPISNIAAFASHAQTLCGQLIMPRHDGIFIQTIPSASGGDTGYLAVWIERSDRRPHRSEAGDKYYYKRAGSNSVAMEHFDVEDAFNRLAPPDLSLSWSVTPDGTRTTATRTYEVLRITLGLVNTSRMSAIMPYLKIVSSRNAGIDGFGLDGNRNHGLLQKPWDRGLFAGGADDAVHPGQSLPVTKLIVEIEDGEDDWVISGSRESEIEISYECGCSNAQMRAGSLTITTSELRTTLGRKR